MHAPLSSINLIGDTIFHHTCMFALVSDHGSTMSRISRRQKNTRQLVRGCRARSLFRFTVQRPSCRPLGAVPSSGPESPPPAKAAQAKKPLYPPFFSPPAPNKKFFIFSSPGGGSRGHK